ncbi:MAG: glutathione S-transferase N-terminal domain-containing protein [Pseudomonadota bacterium]
MIELYYWPTPNGHKVTMFLEEAGLAYEIKPINIGTGEQFEPAFLKISPNNRMPALVDTDEKGSDGDPLSIFESGAILEYLADKTGLFLPTSGVTRYETLQWLYWQMGGLGPMLGQNHHFRAYAPVQIEYAIDRYTNEAERLYGVLDEQLEGKDFITGSYSIADMACYPWIVPHERQGQDLEDFPHLKAWFHRIKERPATETAYAKGREISDKAVVSEDAKKVLFGQGRRKRQ